MTICNTHPVNRISSSTNMIFSHVVQLFLIWTLTSTSLFSVDGLTSQNSTQGYVVDTISNLCLTSNEPSNTKTHHASSLPKCVLICTTDNTCASLTFVKSNGTCYTNRITSASVTVVVQHDLDCVFAEVYGRNDEYHLVFRATAGNGLSVYDAWNNVGHFDDSPTVSATNFGCLTLDGRLPCDKHYRSWRLDDWNNIAKLKFAFYSESRGKMRVVFRNLDDFTNPTDVFGNAELNGVHGNDLYNYTGTFNFFSVEGFPLCNRRFYINQKFGGMCTLDYGWMVVTEEPSDPAQCCSFDNTGPYPQFMYSISGEVINWSNETAVGRADVFAVMIKYKL